jgi:hypothetical protein
LLKECLMPTLADRLRRLLPSRLTGQAGIACAACCVLPMLLAAGALPGAGWATVGDWMPGIDGSPVSEPPAAVCASPPGAVQTARTHA